jgi:glycerophosphoryl diester phosphodiesterase
MRRVVFLGVMASLLLLGCARPSDPTADASTEAPEGVSGPSPSDLDGASDAGEPARTPRRTADRPAPSPDAPTSIAARFDCLRETGGVLVIAHRGGPNRSHPENAIESFARTLRAGTEAIEVDVAQTRDGVLFLHHDDELDRTTNGTGEVGETSWADVEALKLETAAGPTEFSPATLEEALRWAKENRVFVEVDKKRSTSFDSVLDVIETEKAENNVLVITYTDEQAIEVHERSKAIVITASIDSLDQLDRLIARGVDPKRLIAWTGIEAPNPDLWKALAEREIESAFGTLGRSGERLDDRYWEDRSGSEYRELVSQGLTVLVTDYSDRVSRELDDYAGKQAACGF